MFPYAALEVFAPDIVYIHTTNRNVTAYPRMTDDAPAVDAMLDAGAESWAREILQAGPGERRYTGDFSAYDVASQTRKMERYYLDLFHALEADSR